MLATLTDLKNELNRRLRDSGDLVIKTNGKSIPIKDLSDSQLINLVNKLSNPKSTDIYFDDFWI